MPQRGAAVALAVAIATALLFSTLFRYEIVRGPGVLISRLDRWTGRITICHVAEPPAMTCQ